MTLFDGQLGKQGLLERLGNLLLSGHRALIITATIFAISVVTGPVVMYISFAHFTDKEAPWWFDPMTGVWFSFLFLSGFILLLLGIAKLIEVRRTDINK